MRSLRAPYGLLLFLLAATLGTQLIAIQRPYAGHFASYQATVMASMSRNFLRENFSDLLHPKTDVMLLEGKRSLHLNQYPFPALLTALGIKIFGGTFEFWGRFQAILVNSLTALLLSLLAARWFGTRAGWITAAVYSLSPFTLIYGQAFISEPLSLFFLVLALYLLTSEPGAGGGRLALSAFSLSLSVTGRIHFALFYPLFFLFLLSQRRDFPKMASYVLLSIALPFAWYAYTFYVSLYTEGVHTNIFLQADFFKGGTIDLLKGDYWGRVLDIFAQRMLTPLLFPFLLIGLFAIPKKGHAFWILWGGLLLGCSLVILAPPKIMKHDFYLYGLFPFAALVTALGINRVLESSVFLHKKVVLSCLLFLYFAVSARYFINPIFKATAKDKKAVRVAEIVRAATQREDLIVVASKEPPLLIYYADRPAWNMDLNQVGRPVVGYLKSRFRKVDQAEQARFEKAAMDPVTWLEYYRSKGARYLVSLDREDLESIPNLLQHLRQNDEPVLPDEHDFYFFRLTTRS